MDDQTTVLFDTDIGSDIDDAVALTYLLAEPQCEVAGISTVSGAATQRAMLASAICRAAGQSEVPIWSGTESPIIRPQQQPECPQANILDRWPHEKDFQPNEALWNMREIIHSRPGEIVLVSVGPMTNIGLLFAMEPAIPSLIKKMVVMGGSYWRGEEREWNVSCDPHAAFRAFEAAPPETYVYGLDVTRKCRLSAKKCRERFAGGALDVVGDMAEVWFRERDEITFHDPLAACCVFEHDICSYTQGKIQVECVDSERKGYTELDECASGQHKVACNVDTSRFFDRYFDTVAALT